MFSKYEHFDLDFVFEPCNQMGPRIWWEPKRRLTRGTSQWCFKILDWKGRLFLCWTLLERATSWSDCV